MSNLLDVVVSMFRARASDRAPIDPQPRDAAPRVPASAHTEHDLQALVDQYSILCDCVLERIGAANLSATIDELRILADVGASAFSAGVDQYLRTRQHDEDTSRRDLLGLFEQAPGLVCFLRGPTFVFELANAAYFRLIGHRDILGKSVREALPEVSGQGFIQLLENVYQSGEPFVGRGMRLEVQRHAGAPLTEAFVDFIYQPIRGPTGSVIGILVQGNDVTEVRRQEAQRAAAEEALRASEERFRTLFESIDDGFCLLQLQFDDTGEPVDYRFLQTNAAFEGQTGLRDAVGRTARELVPDLDPSWFRLYGRVAITGESTRFENHAPAMGRWFDVYASRVGPPELRQVALVFKDVTDRKRAEEERERLLALESAARRDAEAASRLKDEFLATVSHELRTPLTSMLGWVQMLRARRLTPERHDHALETIERNARAQAQLIEDLLDVSRILAGKLRLELQPVDLQPVVDAALETIRPAAEAKEIDLKASLGPESAVMGDAHRLQQVIWNLLSNAVKFTPAGGRVEVHTQRRDGVVDVTVSDTGQGIEKAFQPYVFERFRQEDGGTTRSHGGLGLGLSIVRQLVDMHGGTVSVMSDGPDRGSTFTLQLPATTLVRRERRAPREPRSSTHPTEIPSPPELRGLRVLLVDDEVDAREMLRTLLEGSGALVRDAASVAEALRLFQAEPPEVIISDIGMPGRDGYDLVGKIRSFAPADGGDVPVIALSAYARTEDRTRALLSGFTSHVPKPVEPMELLAVVVSLSRRARSRPA